VRVGLACVERTLLSAAFEFDFPGLNAKGKASIVEFHKQKGPACSAAPSKAFVTSNRANFLSFRNRAKSPVRACPELAEGNLLFAFPPPLRYPFPPAAFFPPHRRILRPVQHLRQFFLDLCQPVGPHLYRGLIDLGV